MYLIISTRKLKLTCVKFYNIPSISRSKTLGRGIMCVLVFCA